jgi:hypothetical protein
MLLPRATRESPESLVSIREKSRKVEHRSDIRISTLAEYIEAMGGRLEIRAVFKDLEVRITQFDELAG